MAGDRASPHIRLMNTSSSNRFSRRWLLASLPVSAVLAACSGGRAGHAEPFDGELSNPDSVADWQAITEAEWKARLTPEQFRVLRREGTERAFTSLLNEEKRAGIYHCAGCDLPLFSSDTKYESGTGWPSFWKPLENAMDTKPDNKLWYTRTEYHCRRCGGHQGHVFNDGPRPTGQRWCNNGVALTFKPA